MTKKPTTISSYYSFHTTLQPPPSPTGGSAPSTVLILASLSQIPSTFIYNDPLPQSPENPPALPSFTPVFKLCPSDNSSFFISHAPSV